MKPLFAKGNRRTKQKLLALKKQAQADKQPRVFQRIQGIIMSLEKQTTVQIAKLLNVDRTTVYLWISNWNNHKEDGLLEGHRSGRPARLNQKQYQCLYDIVESGPVAYGFNSGVWTSTMVAQVINDEFGVSYHPAHVRKLLKKIGFSVQRPTTGLIQASKKKKNKWTRYTYPNLKKKAKKKKQ